MTISNSLQFDVVIYSANLAGIIAASVLKSKGKKVLLLNRYGFVGGTLTESLNLYQKKIPSAFNKSDIINQILRRIYSNKDGILFENEDYFVLNPEVIKYILQKFCEEKNIELLFHIAPYKIEFREDQIDLIIIGREGKIYLKCKSLLDFSTEFTFAPLIDKSSRILKKSFVNFITLPVSNEKIFDDVYCKIKLRDNRWWISIEHKDLNLLNVEELAQNSFEEFDIKLRERNSRIQIIPAQSNLIFEFQKSDKFDKKISFITDFVSSFNVDDEVIFSNKIEKFFL